MNYENCETCKKLLEENNMEDLFYCNVCEHYGTKDNECKCRNDKK